MIKTKEEPYHYLQKRLSTIVEELTSELNDNITTFRSISKEAYEIEESVVKSRNNYIQLSREIDREIKRQKEVEEVLDYFESEIDRLKDVVKELPNDSVEEQGFSAITDMENLIMEFNSLIGNIDLGIPNRITVLINENVNLLSYLDKLTEKIKRVEEGAAGRQPQPKSEAKSEAKGKM